MSYQQRDNSGSLFRNERKEKDTHADYRGECLIDGQAYYMDAWLKTAESGRKWMSFSFKPKQAKEETKPPPRTHAEMKRGSSAPSPKSTGFEDMDSDIQF